MKLYCSHVFILLFSISSCLCEAPPTVERIGKPIVILNQGENAELQCKFTGDPYPTIKWLKYPGSMDKETVTNRPTLELKDVTKADADSYFCTAKNRLGKGSKGFRVYVTYSPKIERVWEDKQDPGSLLCFVKGYPAPDVSWEMAQGAAWVALRNGTKYKISTVKTMSSSFGRLKILSLSPADGGKYRCRAANSIGIDKKSVRVKVVPHAPIVTTIGPYTREVKEGSDFTLKCRVRAYPPAKIVWLFDGAPIAEGGTLVIKGVCKKDEGVYLCRGINSVQYIDGKYITVTVIP